MTVGIAPNDFTVGVVIVAVGFTSGVVPAPVSIDKEEAVSAAEHTVKFERGTGIFAGINQLVSSVVVPTGALDARLVGICIDVTPDGFFVGIPRHPGYGVDTVMVDVVVEYAIPEPGHVLADKTTVVTHAGRPVSDRTD